MVEAILRWEAERSHDDHVLDTEFDMLCLNDLGNCFTCLWGPGSFLVWSP